MRILLVEDEQKVASFILKGLTEENYAVDHAPDGETALSHASIHEYDLIITDLRMPGMGGIEMIRELRQKKQNVPILILTAKDDIKDKVTGLDVGADDYLTKPFAFVELLARIRALLRRQETFAETLTISDLSMDVSSHRVERAGKSIELTAKEFALLEFMLRNVGRTLTRTTIIEHVWDMHFDSDTNLVDVYMTYLRRKIERGFKSRLLHSVRGVGYIMEEREQ